MLLKIVLVTLVLITSFVVLACSKPTPDTVSTENNSQILTSSTRTTSNISIEPSVGVEGVKEREAIPANIIEKGNQFVISRVGLNYFTKYISFDSKSSRLIEGLQPYPYYFLVYTLIIPEITFVNEIVEFNLDLDGNVLSKEVGIPNLINNPGEGKFPIDETKAKKIAKETGLEPGIKEWETSFHWYYGDFQTFVWTVSNTLVESDSGGSGNIIAIDANDGKVLQQLKWVKQP